MDVNGDESGEPVCHMMRAIADKFSVAWNRARHCAALEICIDLIMEQTLICNFDFKCLQTSAMWVK